MIQPLQIASSATDKQLISSTVTQEIRLQQKDSETEEQRREKRLECDRKRRKFENNDTKTGNWKLILTKKVNYYQDVYIE